MRSHEEKVVPVQCNFLSYKFQRKIILEFYTSINLKLLSYLPENYLIPELAGATLADLNQRMAKQKESKDSAGIDKMRFVHAIHNEFIQATKKFQKQIDKKAIDENNLGIIAYIKTIQLIFQEARALVSLIPSVDQIRLKEMLNDLDSKCHIMIKMLDELVDITIYQVKIPKDDYKKLTSEKFLYYGRSKSAIGALGGLAVAPAIIGFLPFISLYCTPFIAYSYFTNKPAIREDIAKCFKKAADPISSYGYACRQDFPAEWIVGSVNIDVQDNIILETPNPHYRTQDNCNTIYILDGRAPEHIFKHGTDFFPHGCSGNPHGRVIYFHNPVHASNCAALQTDGSKFDARSGWRLQNNWKINEREFANTRLREEIDSALQPISVDLVNIICDYDAVAKPRLKS
ncbi:MAG: hypothetical protein ACYCQI_00990 [Gammaproteobacteria bacterium]